MAAERDSASEREREIRERERETHREIWAPRSDPAKGGLGGGGSSPRRPSMARDPGTTGGSGGRRA